MPARTHPPVSLREPSILMGGLHVAALWAIAVVQPLLNLLGGNPDFFVARDNTSLEIVTFAFLLTFAPPLVAGLIEAGVAAANRKARWFLHVTFVGILFSAIALQFLKQFLEGPALPMILAALVPGCGLTWAYAGRRFMRSLTDILVIAPPVILVVFLFFSPVSKLTFSVPEVSAKSSRVAEPAPVVFVVFDEFPVGSLMTTSGEVNARRFPNFDLLAKTGTWYRNTATTSAYTAIAVPSILTGQPAKRDALPTSGDHPDSIFTLLGGSFRVRAAEPITQLCPEDICGTARETEREGTLAALRSLVDDLRHVVAHLVLPESLASGLPDISHGLSGFGGDSIERGRARQWVRDRLNRGVTSAVRAVDLSAFLDDLASPGGPRLDFVHLEEPHYPWVHYPNGQRYAGGSEDFRSFTDETSWFAPQYVTDRARQAHLLEAGYADHLLGQVIRALKAAERWDETLLVVTADHGAALTRGLHRREARSDTVGEIGMVPLFIKHPGQRRGRTVNRPTCTTEILPMVAEALKAPVDWPTGECDRSAVRVDNGTGPVVEVPFGRAIAQRNRYVKELADLFGAETGWPGVLALGDDRDLIGRKLSSFPRGEPMLGAAKPDEDSSLNSTWRPDSGYNPVLRQRGTVELPPGEPLAISVNGRIVATGESYGESDETRYSILLPERFLKAGTNRIALHLVQVDSLTDLWTSVDQ